MSEQDGRVLTQVGAYLGRLAGVDLAARCAAGKGGPGGRVSKHAGRGERKQALTALSSSRWAGAITRYLDASWTAPRAHVERDLATLQHQPTVGVDLNGDHLACWVLDTAGNPVDPAHTIPLALDGDRVRRDGQLRAAISALLGFARTHGCASITVENLNFSDARRAGRETMGTGRRGKRSRRTVAGIPTATFRDRSPASPPTPASP